MSSVDKFWNSDISRVDILYNEKMFLITVTAWWNNAGYILIELDGPMAKNWYSTMLNCSFQLLPSNNCFLHYACLVSAIMKILTSTASFTKEEFWALIGEEGVIFIDAINIYLDKIGNMVFKKTRCSEFYANKFWKVS